MYPLYSLKNTRGKDKTPRKRQIKPTRELTVSSISGYGSSEVPAIRINGKWLEDYGFHQGDKVTVECKEGELVIKKLENK